MSSALLCLIGFSVFAAGYLVYSRFLARHVFELKDDEPVPSKELYDGVDYVPSKRDILFGHHYASIAGVAPIVGPAIAVIWGWAPAFLWVVLGTVFMGAVHDFATLVLSVRKGGQSVGKITEEVIGLRSRNLFLLVVFLLVLLVIAVFARAIASLFVAYPGTVIPINFEILVALLMGYVCYRRKVPLFWPSILALLSLYAMVWVGVRVPVSLTALAGGISERTLWVVLLLIYSFIASVIPVWVLLQPRDYINSHQLFVGLLALVAGVFIANPKLVAPAFNVAPPDAPSLVPFLFVTVACGAISGFHGLVSSGTTSKQIERAPDCRMIGYGGALGEGVLALLATLAVSAGLADWASHYHSFEAAAAGGIAAFVQGASSFLLPLGIPASAGQVLIGVMVISFAATSLDTGVRIQRYILHELGEAYGIGVLKNRYVAGGVAVLLPFFLYLAGTDAKLWPLFGATNQLLAGLSLVIVTLWMYSSGRRWAFVGVPMVLVLIFSAVSMSLSLAEYLSKGDYLLLVAGGVVLALEVWIVLEATAALRRLRRGESAATAAQGASAG